MSHCKEVLLSCFVLLHISFMASEPAQEVKLRKHMKAVGPSWCDLLMAENDYVKIMFNEDPPDYRSNSTEPLEGITFPVGNNTKEILDTICVINAYLENLPEIIRNLTQQYEDIILNVKVFHDHFKAAVKLTMRGLKKGYNLNWCHTNVDKPQNTDEYSMKLLGIRIIYFSRLWVKSFTGIQLSCESL